MAVLVPPIKCQGIKTKLVPLIKENLPNFTGRFIEPFCGSCVVGLNVGNASTVFADMNPYIISFYNSLKDGSITPDMVRSVLEIEAAFFAQKGGEHYYELRNAFNKNHNPVLFLALNRCCFNGLIRFNKKGEFNTPYCKKDFRFSKAYTTKIVNQVQRFQDSIHRNNWLFWHRDFVKTIKEAREGDFVYCDPPYLGRNTDYFSTWTEDDEKRLFDALRQTPAKFMVSTWVGNEHRKNDGFARWESCRGYHIVTQEHFYHVGASEENRKPMVEALVMNYSKGIIR